MEEQYEKLRGMIRDLTEFMGMQQAEICAQVNWSPSSMTRFLKGEQENVYYAQGRAIEALHVEHADTIKAKKIEKANALMASVSNG